MSKRRYFENLTGKRFGRLTVIGLAEKVQNHNRMWICMCDCGKEHLVTGSNLRSGSISSCGCLKKDIVRNRNYIHGKSQSKLHGVWRDMKQRCYNPKKRCFYDYGGRGIEVCAEWKDDFMEFYNWAINNGYEEGKSIDRINVNEGYKPNNCRWTTAKNQANNKRNNIMITAFGETHTLSEWAEKSGIDRKTIHDRIYKFHWEPEKAIEAEPMKTYDHRRNKAKCVNE